MTDRSRPVSCSFLVNGREWADDVAPDETLLDVLQFRIELKGTRRNCEQGECGACTVLLDGEAVNSCLLLAASTHGHSVETIEGLEQDGVMDDLQEAFVRADASQCGFCTSGVLMAAKALVSGNPTPTSEDAREALLGNYCRCTGYVGIVDAVLSSTRPNDTTSWAHNRHHVSGATRYLADMTVPGMLHGALVTLPVARASIHLIDVSRASGLPGVVRVFTGADFSENGIPRFGPIVADQPILASGMTRFEGEPVAIVVAESEENARAAARAVHVDYEELPGIVTWEAARSRDLIHDPASRPEAQSRWADTNIMAEWAFDWGESETAEVEASAELVIENTYEAPFAHHFHLEPHGTICIPSDGGVEVLTPIQHPFVMRRVLATMLGLDPEAVRVRATDSGGGFGGKGYPKLEPLAAACSLMLGRPLKLSRTAEESFLLSQREASHIRVRSGFSSAGDLLFQDIDADFLVGAYTDISPAVVSKTTLYALGPYRTPTARVRGRGLFTNTAPATAFRGFGATHMSLAIEGQMNAAAHKLGIDPVELRLRNARHKGDEIAPYDTPVDGDWPELLRRVAAAAQWNEPTPAGRGRGIAYGMKVNSAATTSSARVHFDADGKVTAYVGTTEMGQGQRDSVRMIVAQALGLPTDVVSTVMGDTGLVPFDSWTASSRSTVFMGNALRAACEDIKEQLVRLAATSFAIDIGDVQCRDGALWVKSEPIPYERVVAAGSPGGVTGEGTFSAPSDPRHPLGGAAPFYELVATAVELHIDQDTGQIIIDRIAHGSDAGKVINRGRAERMDEGGLVMGLSLALSEQLVFDPTGRLRNGSSLDYRIATVADMPGQISHVFLENGDGPGPFGAKGLAEGGILAVAPAICGAILDLTGVHATTIPLTPEALWKRLKARKVEEINAPGAAAA